MQLNLQLCLQKFAAKCTLAGSNYGFLSPCTVFSSYELYEKRYLTIAHFLIQGKQKWNLKFQIISHILQSFIQTFISHILDLTGLTTSLSAQLYRAPTTKVSVSTVQPSINLEFLCTQKKPLKCLCTIYLKNSDLQIFKHKKLCM